MEKGICENLRNLWENNHFFFLQHSRKKCIFASKFIYDIKTNSDMENEKDMREEVLRRYRSTREKKKKCIEDMKELLEKRYIERTGEKPKYFFSL